MGVGGRELGSGRVGMIKLSGQENKAVSSFPLWFLPLPLPLLLFEFLPPLPSMMHWQL